MALVRREGNPSKRPLREGLKVKPGAPVEPDWTSLFPVESEDGRAKEDAELCRLHATGIWNTIVPALEMAAALSVADSFIMEEFCPVMARIRVYERRISLEGGAIEGRQKSWVRHPLQSSVTSYHQLARMLAAEIGLSPSSRERIRRPANDDDDAEWAFD